MSQDRIFKPADIWLPTVAKMESWSVVACDQYTSEPAYWEGVKKLVGSNASTLHMVVPEIYLSQGDISRRAVHIRATMEDYIFRNVISPIPDSYIYVERKISTGIRRGLIGRVDLEQYSYDANIKLAIRPTEGTITERIPPRMQVRRGAPLELPHTMLLLDDESKSVIEPLEKQKQQMQQLYRFELMEGGGEITGWRLDDILKAQVDRTLDSLFTRKRVNDSGAICMAVGDGNHSLATAKACWEELKQSLPRDEWENHPARWTLVELGNLYDDSLVLEAIHRVITYTNVNELLDFVSEYLSLVRVQDLRQTNLITVVNGRKKSWRVGSPTHQLVVGSLQEALDKYLETHPGKIDYVHGSNVAAQLSKQQNTITFLLPVIQKKHVFQTVEKTGALPRKTFSMGQARDKRYYLECRKI